MILVYTHQITPRIRYVFKHIFTRILQLPIDFTTSVDAFVAFSGPKMSYTKVALGTEFFIRSNDLLFEQGVNDMEIYVQAWDGVPCFFNTGAKSALPFDVFAASFYLISRYEEYLPHVKDLHGRYTATESLAFKNDFLEKPLVDIWAQKFATVLGEHFPKIDLKKHKYRFISTIDVDNAYAYKHKNLVRSFGAILKDIYSLQLKNVWDRVAVLFSLKKDPFNTFSKLIRLKKQTGVKTIFFFLLGDYSTFDTNVSASKEPFRMLVKSMVDYARVGLHPSYFTMEDEHMLKKEKKRMESISNMPVIRSRQHYLRFSLPATYQHLIDLEILEDYSMGYASHVGFRASTCTPFYFYDLDFEIQTPLKIFPFALMDTTLHDYMRLTPKQSLGKIRDLKNAVAAVNGTFITLFHNESLSGYLRWKGWSNIYESMLKIATKE